MEDNMPKGGLNPRLYVVTKSEMKLKERGKGEPKLSDDTPGEQMALKILKKKHLRREIRVSFPVVHAWGTTKAYFVL